MGRHLLAPLLVALAAAPAAALEQPDGTVIPQGRNLVDFLEAEGESLDPVAAAAVTPETFDPSCSLTFTVIGRGAGQRNSFGWYNVTGARPANHDLHEFLACDDEPGTVKVLDIRSDPAYAGGRIGFFMATTEGRSPPNCVDFGPDGPDPDTLGYLYFSERQYNDDNQGQDSFIHLVILDSGVYPRAFYFGWEDLFGGGDNDFEDILTRVEGITCAGGGGACDTGGAGVCAAGSMQCRNGALTCVPHVSASAESCNGFDDDCNGLVDDLPGGATGCAAGEVCDQGRCVGACLEGEFACPGGLVCNDRGFCVDETCGGLSCPPGQVCRNGACAGPCDGITCPLGQVCRAGACADACEAIACDPGLVCDDGICKDPCGCIPCADGEVCAADGRCVDAGCDTAACEPGFVCLDGTCLDACEGAVCPEGQGCVDGRGVAGGGRGGSGGGGGGAGGSGTDGGATDGGGVADGGGAAASGSAASASGCGFTGASGGSLVAVGLALLALARRRR